MSAWFLRRLMQALFVMLAMSVIVFVGIYAIGNPADMMLAPDADQLERARVIAQFGLDQPLWRQYLLFLGNAVKGDLGSSFVYNEPALRVIVQRMPATLELAVAAMLMAVFIGIPLGLLAGLYPDHPASRAVMAGSILGFSLPSFWVGLMLIMVFAVGLGWLPSNGRGETSTVLGVELSIFSLDGLKHMILPALNLAMFKVAVVMRLTRAGVREVLPLDYIRYARAKGLAPRRIVLVHVLRNVLIPVVTVLGIEFGSAVAFAVVTESIFSWPGMGKLLIDSINVLDRPIVVAYLMAIVLFFTLINLVIDLLYGVMDPRARIGAAA
jgi:peptide/nickel transport system permease protein